LIGTPSHRGRGRGRERGRWEPCGHDHDHEPIGSRPSRELARLAWVLAACLAAPGWASQTAEQNEPAAAAPVVRKIELRSDTALERSADVLRLVTLEPGKPLDEAEVRRTLRGLHASGLASEVELWVRPLSEGEVAAVVALWGALMVEAVELEGKLGLRREALRREVVQTAGAPLVEDRVLRSVFRLVDRLRAEGYLSARVRARVDVDHGRRRARVVFEIDSGERARVGRVEISGDLGTLQESELLARLRARPGASYRQALAREDEERLRRWLLEQGFLKGEVEVLQETHDRGTETVDLTFRVVVGPKVQVRIVGADRRELERRGLLPFLGEEGFDEVLVLQAMERIVELFQERGHYRAAVSRHEVEEQDSLQLVLQVDAGPVYTLTDIHFDGNEEVPGEELQELMTTAPRRFLVAGSGRLVDRTLAQDLENIRSYYALNGWSGARVGPARVEEEGGDLTLVVPIVEGPRSRVVEVLVDGMEALELETVLAQLPIRAGGPFHPILLEESLDRIRSVYEEEGYAAAQVSADVEWHGGGTVAEVQVRIFEGRRQVAGNLVIRGNQQTESAVIRRFAGLETGEPLSYRRLLEVQRNLYRLGIFSRVEVTLAPIGDAGESRDVVVRVEEARNQRVAYGAGYNSEEGFGGLLSYSHGNLWGRAHRFQADTRVSERHQRYRLLFNHPVGGGPWAGALTYLLYQEAEDRLTFDARRRGAQVELSRDVRQLRLSLFLDYRQVATTLAEGVVLEDLPSGPDGRNLQDIEILSLIPRLVWDRRDDFLDPRSGYQVTVQAQYAFPAGSLTREHFLKLFAQYSHYLDLGAVGVLAGSVRAGQIQTLGDRPVPLAERFFAGGRASHRAFGRDLLGVAGETLDENGRPVGGSGLVVGNLEYRVPIIGSLAGTLFVDAGNVWRSWDDIGPGQLRWGAGAGLRYLSPVGPLRLDAGWKLDRRPGEPPVEIFLSFGNPF
jgi:outer membrane protein insertion porin family